MANNINALINHLGDLKAQLTRTLNTIRLDADSIDSMNVKSRREKFEDV